ncbi:SHOCT domain-containing protein [Halovivax limisalsi]|uniref:SHOCT domain-containing protein n=1 Tax=Halovivax limisalsi TaxID=1453760 RepID=UPI001FFC6F5B|nr:SHOCT domain-containing protein [Halovivax limisalsi]
MGFDTDALLGRLDLDLIVIFAFVLAIILINRSPYLLAVLGGLVFLGWVLVQLGVFEDDAADETTESEGPLEALQTRYARGEIDEAEFERRLDRIMESTDAVDRRGGSASVDPELDRLETDSGDGDAAVRRPETERS